MPNCIPVYQILRTTLETIAVIHRITRLPRLMQLLREGVQKEKNQLRKEERAVQFKILAYLILRNLQLLQL
jgi:hypothetical protein